MAVPWAKVLLSALYPLRRGDDAIFCSGVASPAPAHVAKSREPRNNGVGSDMQLLSVPQRRSLLASMRNKRRIGFRVMQVAPSHLWPELVVHDVAAHPRARFIGDDVKQLESRSHLLLRSRGDAGLLARH